MPDYFLGLRSSWEIDVWGKLRNQKKAAYARFVATEKARHLITTALVAEIGSLYYELLALDNKLETVRKNIWLQETAVEMITIQKEGGRANELAVKQFTTQLLSVPSDLLRRRPNIQQAELELVAAKADVQAVRAAFLPLPSLPMRVSMLSAQRCFSIRAP